MQQRQVRRLPVLDGSGKLMGIVSLNDLALRATHGPNLIQRNHEVRVVEQTLEAVSRSRAMQAGPRA
jgi:CBS-domain-containing membrane protein